MGGNRSILVDHDLSGMIVGLTLATRPEEVYRALLEATAFGTRVIVEAFEAGGVPVTEFVVAGGLKKNSFLMQLYADILRRPVSVAVSEQAPALGSAIHAAVAAGAYPDVASAAEAMGACEVAAYVPDPARADAYDVLFAEYRALHDAFGRCRGCAAPAAQDPQRALPAPPTAPTLPRTTRQAQSEDRREHRHSPDPPRGLRPARRVGPLPAGGVDRGQRLGPRPGGGPDGHQALGVAYDDLTPENMIVCDLDGKIVEGDLFPSSDTAAHAYVYRHMPEVGGVVHTHSTYASAWAARGEEVPCVLTAMADEFGGEIPVGPFALIGDDSIGRGIVQTLAGSSSPAVLMRNHGVFSIGGDAKAAVKAAVMTEDVARTVHIARVLGTPLAIAENDITALYDRYQNVYGQSADRMRPPHGVTHSLEPHRSGSSPVRRACTARRRYGRSPSSPKKSPRSSTRPARSPCRSSGGRCSPTAPRSAG